MHQALAAFALLAVLVRAVLPTGYMYGGLDASGRQAIVTLCSSSGPIEIAIDLTSGAVREAPGGHTDTSPSHPPCVFAGAAALEAPALIALPVSERVDAAPLIWTPGIVRPGLGLAAPPPPAIGPPAIV